MTLRDIVLIAALFATFTIASLLGLPEAMGAHPFWAARTGVIGSAIGAACLILMQWAGLTTGRSLALSGAGLILASGATWFGKRGFAASFAEDVLAGRFWFFGWFAIAASLFVLVGILLLDRVRR